VLDRERPERPAEETRELGVEVAIGDPANVVLAEDRRVQFSTST
jgi:hypothetical protein